MADTTISQLTKGTPAGNNILPYSTGTNTLGVPVSAVFQNTSANVGINTNNPLRLLHVEGTTPGAQQVPLHVGVGNDSIGFGVLESPVIFGWNGNLNNAHKPLSIRSTSGVQLFLNTNGNVGIGTSAPAVKLDVNGTVYANQFGEYGTWTPYLRSHSNPSNTGALEYDTTTQSQYIANYWKIGNFVYFNCLFNLAPIAGHVLKYIYNLPYTIKSLGSSNNDNFASSVWPYIKGYPCALGHCRGIQFRWANYGYNLAPTGATAINNFTLGAVVCDNPGLISGNSSPFIYFAASSDATPFFGFWYVSGTASTTEGGQYANISGFYPIN